MKAVETKYLGATDTKGSRIKASDSDNNYVIIPYPHELSGEAVYRKAAKALCEKMGWTYDRLVAGSTKHGYVFVFVDDDVELLKRIDDQQKKIDEAITLLSTVLCSFDTKQELLDWSVNQQTTFLTYMVTAYFVLTDGKYERFKGDGHLGLPIESRGYSYG